MANGRGEDVSAPDSLVAGTVLSFKVHLWMVAPHRRRSREHRSCGQNGGSVLVAPAFAVSGEAVVSGSPKQVRCSTRRTGVVLYATVIATAPSIFSTTSGMVASSERLSSLPAECRKIDLVNRSSAEDRHGDKPRA